MTLKIEVGKEYVTRGGEVVRCASAIEPGTRGYENSAFWIHLPDGGCYVVTKDGDVDTPNRPNSLDIIAEHHAAEPTPTNALNPLPSFLRASAQDAANMQMRKANRTAWSEEDRDLAASTLDRLVRSCYGRPDDHNQPDYCFIRFQHAERLEKQGRFNHRTSLAEISREIDALCDAWVPVDAGGGA